MSLIFLPRTPPALFACSIVSTRPLCELWPKVAVSPVIDAYSPRTISLLLEEPPLRLQESTERARRVMVKRSRQRMECSWLNWPEFSSDGAIVLDHEHVRPRQ